MQERAKRTRERILRAAQGEFALHGLHGARIDRIARRAEANKERLYAYFHDKETLFAEVLHHSLEEIVDEEKLLLEQIGDDATRLSEAILNHYMSFHRAHPQFWRLLAWENLTGGQHARSLRGMKDATFERLRRVYRRGQKQGVFKKGVPFEAFILTLSAVAFFYFSNQLTMRQTLSLDLARDSVRKKMSRDILHLLDHETNGNQR